MPLSVSMAAKYAEGHMNIVKRRKNQIINKRQGQNYSMVELNKDSEGYAVESIISQEGQGRAQSQLGDYDAQPGAINPSRYSYLAKK